MDSPTEDQSRFDHPYFKELGENGYCRTNEEELHEVVNQEQCNSCTMQAVTFTTAAAVAIQDGKKYVKLSSQCCVDCGPHNKDNRKEPDKQGCKTSRFQHVYDFAKEKGFYKDSDYEYTGKKGECLEKKAPRLHIGGTGKPRSDEILDRIRQQPVTARIKVTPKFAVFSGEGVYDPVLREGEPIPDLEEEIPENTHHAVSIIGFGVTADGKEYFIIQNSYGTNWGFRGYAKVPRSCLSCFRYPMPPYVWSE